MRSVHILVAGMVQGVGFRQFVRSRAAAHGILGWVRNLPDGRVECRAEGEDGPMDRFLADLRRGPMLARVDSLHVENVSSEGLDRFQVTF